MNAERDADLGMGVNLTLADDPLEDLERIEQEIRRIWPPQRPISPQAARKIRARAVVWAIRELAERLRAEQSPVLGDPPRSGSGPITSPPGLVTTA